MNHHNYSHLILVHRWLFRGFYSILLFVRGGGLLYYFPGEKKIIFYTYTACEIYYKNTSCVVFRIYLNRRLKRKFPLFSGIIESQWVAYKRYLMSAGFILRENIEKIIRKRHHLFLFFLKSSSSIVISLVSWERLFNCLFRIIANISDLSKIGIRHLLSHLL